MAYIDSALPQQVLDVSQRKRETNAYHYRKTDDFLLLLKYLNRSRFGMAGGYEIALPASNRMPLTSPLELYDAMYKDGEIAYVGARDERAAGHMADAWARMTGKPGVVLGE